MTDWKGLSGRAKGRVELSVEFESNKHDGSYVFHLPCGGRLQLSEHDVNRSRPLRDMMESAATYRDTTITFPSSLELSHFHIWAAAVQPGSTVFQADAKGMKRCLEVRSCMCTAAMVPWCPQHQGQR